MSEKKRNYTIDLLRFVAAAWVALFHFNEPIAYVDNWYRAFAKYGALGVPIFFVISGYCIALSAENSRSAQDFLMKRFFRIFPAYWFSLAVVLVAVVLYVLIFGQNSTTVLPKTPVSILATMSLLTSPFTRIPTMNWVYWTLTVELFFYLSMCLSIIYKGIYTKLALIVISLLSFSKNLQLFPLLFFMKYWAPFGMGLSLYYFNLKDIRSYKFSIFLFLLNTINLFYLNGFDMFNLAAIVAALAIFVSLWIKDVRPNLLSRLGDYSYAVYLLHVPVGIHLLGKLKMKEFQQISGLNILFDLVDYLIILSFSYLTYRFIELPGIAAGRKMSDFFRKRQIQKSN